MEVYIHLDMKDELAIFMLARARYTRELLKQVGCTKNETGGVLNQGVIVMLLSYVLHVEVTIFFPLVVVICLSK